MKSTTKKHSKKKFDPGDDARQERDDRVGNDLIGRHGALKILDGIHKLGKTGISKNQSKKDTAEKEDPVGLFFLAQTDH